MLQIFIINSFSGDETTTIGIREELEKIKKACSITDDCFEHLKSFIKVGMSEKEIANEIENFFLKNGADELAFDTIVASGKNS